MRVLVLQHLPREGLGSLGPYLESMGAEVEFLRLYEEHEFPAGISDYAAIICLGGFMHPDQEAEHPFLIPEKRFLRAAMESGKPVLGLCLGAQLIAAALGAEVYAMEREEFGLVFISLTRAGIGDPFFAGMPDRMPVVAAHRYTFDLPSGAVLLASSEACPNQVFRYGNSYAVQFHAEATVEKIAYWLDEADEAEKAVIDAEAIMAAAREAEAHIVEQANGFYRNFFGALL